MALTRAQLLMGNSSQGVVLSGQTQGVRQGVGVIIAADGTISFDSTTATGVLKTNNPTAYNAYVWPTTRGVAGQQLQLGAAGALSWEDPDQIPWTAKGQLIAGTGVGTSTILNVGVDGSILIADSTQTSGLGYTTNFVATTSSTGAANIPAGPVGSRPVSPISGQFRFSTTSGEMEFWDGTSWQTIASSQTGLFVEKTSTNGSAVIPAGTTAQRDSSPSAGFFRYDSTLTAMEFYDGSIWQIVSTSGNSVVSWSGGSTGLTPSVATTGAVTLGGTLSIGSGGTGQTSAPAAANALLPSQTGNAGEVLTTDGSNLSWTPTVTSIVAGTNITITPGGTGAVTINAAAGAAGVTTFSGGSTGLLPSAATAGAVTLSGTLLLANGGTSATTQPGAANAILPLQTGNVGYVLKTDGSNVSWIDPGSISVSSWSGGTTGLLPSVATTGAVTVSGTLALANGGTGATTQSAAANNILPTQGGNANKFLTTNGTNVSWATAGGTYPPAVGTVITGGVAQSSFSFTLTVNPGDIGGISYAGVMQYYDDNGPSGGISIQFGGGAPGTYQALGFGSQSVIGSISYVYITNCWVRIA